MHQNVSLPTLLTRPTVAVIDGAFEHMVAKMFEENGFRTVDNLDAAELICFTGGADISPQLYGEIAIPGTHAFPLRDEAEIAIYKQTLNKPKVGICRGAQLMNVMNGGKMWQNVNGHQVSHMIHDHSGVYKGTGNYLMVSSLHHQMMIPGIKGKILATAAQTTRWRGEKGEVQMEHPKDEWRDIEVVYYNATRSLCFQAHPELETPMTTRKYFFMLIEKYLGLKGHE